MAGEGAVGRNMIVGVEMVVESEEQDLKTSLGIVLIAESDINTLTVKSLRDKLKHQLPACPNNYVFCSQQGWPISHQQEDAILVVQIITDDNIIQIKKRYDKPKIGIKKLGGTAVGFIFCDFSDTLSTVRDMVHRQVFHNKGNPQAFQFLDTNGWPIGGGQERSMTVMDVLVGSCITVNIDTSVPALPATPEFSPPEKPPFKKHKMSHDLTFRSGKDAFRQLTPPPGTPSVKAKQILISYVRAEAAEHAITLKGELAALGFSIYLDVDEIKSGVDWQDSLNFAVSDCEVFIPLVTARYGETQWTNREVKLADVLGKYIIPVNFISQWPPRCLAIQFATTQFVPWKPLEEQINTGTDLVDGSINTWESHHIHRVAVQIAERVQRLCARENSLTSVPSLVKRKTIVKSCALVNESNPQAMISDREGRPLIVICIHPDEDEFGEELQQFLEAEQYEVWRSSSVSVDVPDASQVTFADDITNGSLYGQSQSQENNSSLGSLQQFQERADEAGVVLLVLSQAFSRSATCQQQMFYCEHRKRVIHCLYEDFTMPGWISMLMGSRGTQTVYRSSYRENLLAQVRRAFDPDTQDNPREDINEAKISCAVDRLQQKVRSDYCVCIVGGTELKDDTSRDLCRSIGTSLARLDNVVMITVGKADVSVLVGKAFHDEARRLCRPHRNWHVLSENGDRDISKEEALNYGKTLYYGDHAGERDTIISRAFSICILLEGDSKAVRQAEQFHWNDHIVIPVKYGGSDSSTEGRHTIPEKILQVPQGINETDWEMLSDKSLSSTEIGNATSRIVSDVFQQQTRAVPSPSTPLLSPVQTNLSPEFPWGPSSLSPLPPSSQTSPKSILRSPTKHRTVGIIKTSPTQTGSGVSRKPTLSNMRTVILK